MLAQQVGHTTDVVPVAVSQHDRLDLIQAAVEVREVRQDEVDARLVVLGEQHPQSTINNRPAYSNTAMFRPISPNPRGPQCGGHRREFRWRSQVRMRMRGATIDQSTASPTPAKSARRRATSASVAGSSGSRGWPTWCPCRFSAALVSATAGLGTPTDTGSVS